MWLQPGEEAESWPEPHVSRWLGNSTVLPFQGEPFSIPNRLVLGEADITSKVFPGSSCQMLILIITTIIIKRLGSEPSHL